MDPNKIYTVEDLAEKGMRIHANRNAKGLFHVTQGRKLIAYATRINGGFGIARLVERCETKVAVRKKGDPPTVIGYKFANPFNHMSPCSQITGNIGMLLRKVEMATGKEVRPR